MRKLLTFLSISLVFAIFGATVPSAAQDSLDDARTQREDVRREAASVAGELDLLAVDDQAVVDALADIDLFVAQTEANIVEAEAGITRAEADAVAADAEADRLEADIDFARSQVRLMAVSAYITPDDDQINVLLDSADPRDGQLRRFFLEVANGNSAEAIAVLRNLQDDQRVARNQANQARDIAQQLKADLQSDLIDLDEARQTQQAIQDDIERRIGDWESEAAVLETQNDELTQWIIGEEARIEAERQAQLAREREAERQRQAEIARQAAADRQAEIDAQNNRNNTTPPALPPATAPTAFVWPVNGGIASSFGYRIHPIFGVQRFHSGVDLNASMGTPIAAAAPGVVIFAGWRDGYGNTVIIDHGGSFTSLYAHQSQLGSSVGQSVNSGTIIGYVGSTGWSTGAHLHFEIRVKGSPVDPLLYL
jgi:murein DD-endopeptidase MepM/ murein hydrolase activator NlpD